MSDQSLAVMEPVMMLFLIAAVGAVARRAGLLSDPAIKNVTAILLTIAQPALMIAVSQQAHTPEAFNGFLTVVLTSAIFLCAALALLYALLKRVQHDMRAVLTTVSVFPNVGFIGLPIIGSLYGEPGMLYLSGFILGFHLAQWTVGITLFTGFTLKSLRNFLNPVFICTVLGSLFFIFDVRLPDLLVGAVEQLSALNTPLAMLLLGARLAECKLRDLLDKRLLIAASLKLIASPLVMLAALKLLGVQGMALSALVLGAAMPSGTNGQILAERYGGDAAFAAKCISLTTLLCVVSLPAVLIVMSL